MATHELKTWPEEFRAVEEGDKRVEIRKDDRGFEVDDLLVLKEWAPGEDQGIYYGANVDPGFRGYSGREVTVAVTHVYVGRSFTGPPGLLPGYVALSVELERTDGQ